MMLDERLHIIGYHIIYQSMAESHSISLLLIKERSRCVPGKWNISDILSFPSPPTLLERPFLTLNSGTSFSLFPSLPSFPSGLNFPFWRRGCPLLILVLRRDSAGWSSCSSAPLLIFFLTKSFPRLKAREEEKKNTS